jgi:DNA-directed RNA polymerase specialized sigma24 family protein
VVTGLTIELETRAMSDESQDPRLCNITTLWSVVALAHAGPSEEARAARHRLLERYGGAIRRYLMTSLRNPAAAEELFQEFALRFLGGDFRLAHPERGRFRDYVKTSLVHLIGNYHMRRQRQPRPLPPGHPEPPVEVPAGPDLDPVFLANWRDELLAQAWQALAQAETPGHPPLYTALRFRADHPELSSHELAARLGARLGRPLTAAGVRQMLHRARERFADRLVEEVAHSLEDPTPERLAEELIDLELYEHCRPALQRREGEG